MQLLHRPLSRIWVMAAFVLVALMVTNRANKVIAFQDNRAANQLLDSAHDAYTQGQFQAALDHAARAVDQSADNPTTLIKASDYAFVLGMSQYERGEKGHVEAFLVGVRYSASAHSLEPENIAAHRAWAEGLLLAYLYEVPITRDDVRAAWRTLPAETEAEQAYRATALRLVGNPVMLARR